ncbi:MAG: aminoacyl-tRNA hydrolase [Minisyncoccia bacterium]
MSYIIVGLGNPGAEYEGTRHNTGRMIVQALAKKMDFPDWKNDMKLKALVTTGKLGKEKVQLIIPETFMNKSGLSVGPLVKSKKAAESLVVIHDDLDIPLGKMKLSFNKSSGGHKGVESVMKAVKTEAFLRLRVGVVPALASGKLKKPQGEKEIIDFIIGQFKKPEMEIIKKSIKKAVEGLEVLGKEGKEIATGVINSN